MSFKPPSGIWSSLGDLLAPKKDRQSSEPDLTPPSSPHKPSLPESVAQSENNVAAQCMVHALRELEEVHERCAADLRLKQAELQQKEEELGVLQSKEAEWRSLLQQKEEEWAAQLEAKEAEAKAREDEHGAQLGAMTQKNAQMRIDLKQCTKRSSELESALEAERAAHVALQQVTEKQVFDHVDGDAELAQLDASVSRRVSLEHAGDGTGMVRLTEATPSSPTLTPRGDTPSPVDGSARDTPVDMSVHSAGGKPGGCCTIS